MVYINIYLKTVHGRMYNHKGIHVALEGSIRELELSILGRCETRLMSQYTQGEKARPCP